MSAVDRPTPASLVRLSNEFLQAHPGVLLHFNAQNRQWVLDAWPGSDTDLVRLAANPQLSSLDELPAAREWVGRFLTGNNSGVAFGDDMSTWTITEWRHVIAAGRAGWMPLFDFTDIATLLFPASNPATGARTNPAADNQARVRRDRGASPAHPLGTVLTRGIRDDISELAYLLGRSVADLPFARRLIPEPGWRLSAIANHLNALVEHAITGGQGHVDIVREHDPNPLLRERAKSITAAAVWLYHTPHDPMPPNHRRHLRNADDPVSLRLRQLDAAIATQRPTGMHHYLAAFTIVEHRRRQHLGSMLLRTHLALTDTGAIPVVAVAATPEGNRFLQRHMFTAAVPPDRHPIPGAPYLLWHRPAKPEAGQ